MSVGVKINEKQIVNQQIQLQKWVKNRQIILFKTFLMKSVWNIIWNYGCQVSGAIKKVWGFKATLVCTPTTWIMILLVLNKNRINQISSYLNNSNQLIQHEVKFLQRGI